MDHEFMKNTVEKIEFCSGFVIMAVLLKNGGVLEYLE